MYEVGKWIWEHRNEPLTWVTLISFLSLVIDKFGRKLITNQLKRLFHVKDKSAFSTYVENQKRIELKVDMLLSERGLTWVVEKSDTGNSYKKHSPYSLNKGLFAGIVGWFTTRKETFHMRGRLKVKKKLTSRKLWMSIISAALVIANEGLELGISNESVMAFAAIVMSFIFSQGYVDAKEKKLETYGDSGPAED